MSDQKCNFVGCSEEATVDAVMKDELDDIVGSTVYCREHAEERGLDTAS